MDTPMLQRLRAYLDNTSPEQKKKDWADIKALGLKGGPTVWEFMASFKHTPTFQYTNMLKLAEESSIKLSEELP